MSLIGSLGSGVSAMQSFVKGMEVIGDNIANSKTVGYKRQRVNYSDNFSNTLRDSAPGNDGTSNRAPVQIGSGVNIGATKKIYDQGPIESTGIASDLAIAGEGFFRVYDPSSNTQYLTRDGSFRVDEQGYLADKNGHYLLGLTGGTPDQSPDTIGKVRIDLEQNVKTNADGQPLDAAGRIVLDDGTRVQTTPLGAQYRVDTEGHLLDSSAGAATADSILLRDLGSTAARAVFDAGVGDYVLQDAAGGLIDASGASSATAVIWSPTSQIQAQIGDAEASAAVWDVANAFQPNAAAVDENDPNQFRLAIQSWSFGREGDLTVSLNDGTSHTRAKLLLQQVRDSEALTNEGNGLLSGQQNAGVVGMQEWNIGSQISATDLSLHTPSGNGLGYIQGRALENSNTDLTFEFSEMITTQRAFQAGSRVITVSDEMLQEIINLKR